MQKIFMSFADEDAPRLDQMKAELRKRGIVQEGDEFVGPVECAGPGSSVRGALRDAIGASSMVVVLWGRAASASATVNYETGMADALDKPIVLVVPEGDASRPRVGTSDMRVVELPN
jgi:hypothetical protein